MSDTERLEEYRLNVDLWKHDDTLRQAHNQTFLGATSAVLVAGGLVISASDELVVQGLTGVVAALFGIALASVWRRAQRRHNAYIRFHRAMLVSMEAPLGFSTFSDQTKAFQQPWAAVSLQGGAEEFRLDKRERSSGSAAEALMPLLVDLLWTAALVAGVVAIIAA